MEQKSCNRTNVTEMHTENIRERWIIEKPLKEHRFTRSLCVRVLKSECCAAFQRHTSQYSHIHTHISGDLTIWDFLHILKFIGLIYSDTVCAFWFYVDWSLFLLVWFGFVKFCLRVCSTRNIDNQQQGFKTNN